MNATDTAARPGLSHARDLSRPGFYVKLALMCVVNAIGLFGIMASWAQEQWVILAVLAVTLVVADVVYFSKRAVPAKYLFPGLLFLLIFQLFVMAATLYVSFTNYGGGHIDTKAKAIAQIQRTSEAPAPGAKSVPITVIDRDGELAFALVRDGEAMVGAHEQPLEPLDGATVEGNRVTAVEGAELVRGAELQQRQEDVLAMRVPVGESAEEGSLRTLNATSATTWLPRLAYDEDASTFTDADGTVYRADDKAGVFRAENGKELQPGWRVIVGFDNYAKMFTDSRIASMFAKSLGWTFAFAILSVLTTFALGLVVAVIFNDPRVKGRVVYRALFILPYAFPAFLAALVWKGMLNRQFGYVNQVILGGADIGWLTDGNLAKFSILMVNLWLGFPYMFLVCTGALQAIPAELTEAGVMDGAGPIQRFFHVTLPMLMVSVAPLLISSFAFNFNNFSLIYMLTGGGPNYPDSPIIVGETDILISMVYAIAFEGGNKLYGLASALSIIIFVVVGIISWLGFRQTRKLEEIL